jgi:hypothetical protein
MDFPALYADILQAAQAELGSGLVEVLPADPAQMPVTLKPCLFLQIVGYANNRTGEPLGDSPDAPGDYRVDIRFTATAPKSPDYLQAYRWLNECYDWSQRQHLRRRQTYYATIITGMSIRDEGEIVVGDWTIQYRARALRG